MLGDSTALGGAEDAAAPPNMTAETAAGGGVGSNSESDIERSGGERSFGGNRWPRQETLALLRIRSDMETTFRDASVKGPLWDEVSRKLAELGYQRSAKKCKEKFENVYKYHKRTKDGRGGKSDGKTYRFFDQLEALDHIHNHPSTHQNQNLSQISAPTPISHFVTSTISNETITETTTIPMSIPTVVNNTTVSTIPHVTVSSIPMSHNNVVTTRPIMNMNITSTVPPSNPSTSFKPSTTNPLPSFTNFSVDLFSNSMASSYSTSSEDTMLEEGSRKRKRDWQEFFERMMKQVMEKQEDLHKRFLEALEKREQDLIVRQEAWRAQEMQILKRDREFFEQERSITAAKDAAVMSFLQKVTGQENLGELLNNYINIAQQPPLQNRSLAPTPVPAPAPAPTPTPAPFVVQVNAPLPLQRTPVTKTAPPVVQQQQQQQLVTNREIVKFDDNGGENFLGASSSRWPKVEVEALINLRTNMDNKYQENGPKGPLWEEISAGMRNLGYNRNAKRCKEKWENINKYFKKVKESNKKRPEDSKTCPYFHQLDALYKEKGKLESSGGGGGGGLNQVAKAEINMAVTPLMVRPEQQWPPPQEDGRNRGDEEDDDMDEDDKEREEEDMDESGGGNFEVVPSKPIVDASA